MVDEAGEQKYTPSAQSPFDWHAPYSVVFAHALASACKSSGKKGKSKGRASVSTPVGKKASKETPSKKPCVSVDGDVIEFVDLAHFAYGFKPGATPDTNAEASAEEGKGKKEAAAVVEVMEEGAAAEAAAGAADATFDVVEEEESEYDELTQDMAPADNESGVRTLSDDEGTDAAPTSPGPAAAPVAAAAATSRFFASGAAAPAPPPASADADPAPAPDAAPVPPPTAATAAVVDVGPVAAAAPAAAAAASPPPPRVDFRAAKLPVRLAFPGLSTGGSSGGPWARTVLVVRGDLTTWTDGESALDCPAAPRRHSAAVVRGVPVLPFSGAPSASSFFPYLFFFE